MIYSYMTLPDNTEITHTELKNDGTVIVYAETPDEKNGFNHIECKLPGYEWSENIGYSAEKLAEIKDIIESGAHLIMRFAECGGFDHATAV